MDVPALDYKQELIDISSVRTLDIVWKTGQEQWMIGADRKRGTGKSVLVARLNDDDDL